MSWNWPWGRRTQDVMPFVEKKQGGYIGSFVTVYGTSGADWSSGGYNSLAREGYMRNPIAHRAVRLIAEAAAAIPLIVYEGQAEMEQHPLLDLLAYPNQRQSGPSFFETLYGHLLISGNAYVELIEGVGISHELHLLRPDHVSVIADESGWPVALQYSAKNTKRHISLEENGSGLQIRLFHPLDDHYGFGPLSAALQALDIHNSAAHWNKSLLDNSARPSGALIYSPKEGGNLTDDQFERLKSELEEQYVGAERAGRPLLLEGGLDWKTMSLSPKDMDFMEAKNSAARDIALALGIPPMILGIPGDNTYSNYQEANRAFYRLTVLPLVSKITKELEKLLTPRLGENLTLTFDADQIEGLADEREALWRRVNTATFLTDDEKRAAVGYQPRSYL